MSGMLAASGGVVIALMTSLILGGVGFRGARLVGTLATVLLYLAAVTGVGEICRAVLPLAEGELIGDGVRSILKVVGISYTASFVSDMCRDMGEIGVASAVITVGRVEILLISVPYAVGIAELAIDLAVA